jgi:hypothetical protein
MGSLVFTYRQSVFDRALLQSCFEYPREVSLPISPIYMKRRRRLFEPCGADAAGDGRAASSTSPSVPEARWEAVSHLGNVNVNVLAGCTDSLVVHQVMQTYQALPTEGKGWYLVFHDACTGAVEAVDVVAPMPLDEVFKAQKLRRVADGELLVDNTRTKIGASV